ncbi:hypothetical protein V5O48_010563 [Marasmius crinis-equi]|uniref:Uncharacterized protein n=1 Tax=Marasmius crinis-equi TaxID=585013 RepID=A0ABR3F818_9AGAR
MSANGYLQEQDIVASIQQSSDGAFTLKQDLENFKITLSQLAPSIDFKPYAINNGFIKGAQTVATNVHAQVIQNLRMNVLDAAQDPDCSVKEKAEEATSFLKKLAKNNFVLDTGSSTNEFSNATQKVATELDSVTARLNDTAKDESKLKQLTAELASLKKKKADALSKKPAPGQELLNKDDIGKILDEGSKNYDDVVAKGGKVPAKNPLASVAGKVKELSGNLPAGQNTDALQDEIDDLSARIVETEGNIYVTKEVIKKAKRDADEISSARESLRTFDDRFKGIAENLNRLQEVAKAAEGFVRDYNQFLGTEAAKDKGQLKAQTDLLGSRTSMLSQADPALASFTSRVVV